MALPTAHASIALGLSAVDTWTKRATICLLCLLPDFDFALVALGVPLSEAHRTFSHSLAFAVAIALLWRLWPTARRWIPSRWIFAAVISHGLYDMLCTADAADHGVMLLWPASDWRLGWPILVPLYRLVGETPFSLAGAAGFTLLEAIMAWPLWRLSRTLSNGIRRLKGDPA